MSINEHAATRLNSQRGLEYITPVIGVTPGTGPLASIECTAFPLEPMHDAVACRLKLIDIRLIRRCDAVFDSAHADGVWIIIQPEACTAGLAQGASDSCFLQNRR